MRRVRGAVSGGVATAVGARIALAWAGLARGARVICDPHCGAVVHDLAHGGCERVLLALQVAFCFVAGVLGGASARDARAWLLVYISNS